MKAHTMTSPTLLSICYDLNPTSRGNLANLHVAARSIATTPGLIFKLWAIDQQSGRATSSYLFRNRAAAETFSESETVATLRSNLATGVCVRFASVDQELSRVTHAGFILDRAL